MAALKHTSKIFVSGHRGLLGSATVKELKASGYDNVLTATHAELDLTNESATHAFLKSHRPDAVIHCAALVGGIHANIARPAEFLHANLSMQNAVIHGSYLAGVQRLIFFGSNCMYPTGLDRAMGEELLLQGPLEPSNLGYGTAKIAGFVQCQTYRQQYGCDFITVIPASLYGPGDSFDLAQCHVTAALLLRMHQAKKSKAPEFPVWGTGTPRRELLFSADAARGVRLIFEHWEGARGPVNLGPGQDTTVAEIAESVKLAVGYTGQLRFDTTKADGNPRKLLDSSRIASLGFQPRFTLTEGLALTYQWLLSARDARGLKPGDL